MNTLITFTEQEKKELRRLYFCGGEVVKRLTSKIDFLVSSDFAKICVNASNINYFALNALMLYKMNYHFFINIMKKKKR